MRRGDWGARLGGLGGAAEGGEKEVQKLLAEARVGVAKEANSRGGGGAEDCGIESEEEAVGVHGALQLRLPLLLPIRRRHGRAPSQPGRGSLASRGEGGRHWGVDLAQPERRWEVDGGRQKQTHTKKPARVEVEMGRWVFVVFPGFGFCLLVSAIFEMNEQVVSLG